jgi:hypothetical protein
MNVQNPAPTGVLARFQGSYSSVNATTYYYWVQALYTGGYSQLSAAGVTGSHCPAALTSGNFNAVNWNPSPGAIGYVVYRTTTSTAPVYGALAIFIATSETGFKDDGSVAPFAFNLAFNGLCTARMIYDFATDGGVHTAAIVPAISDTIPKGAIVIGGIIYCAATFVGPTAMTIGTTAGSSANSFLTTTAVPAAGNLIIPTAIAAPFLMSAAGQLDLTITVADATAGRLEVMANYIQSV